MGPSPGTPRVELINISMTIRTRCRLAMRLEKPHMGETANLTLLVMVVVVGVVVVVIVARGALGRVPGSRSAHKLMNMRGRISRWAAKTRQRASWWSRTS